MNKKLEKLFNTANAEFWLELDDGLAERFRESVRDYLEDQNENGVEFILKDYKRWKFWNPEAK